MNKAASFETFVGVLVLAIAGGFLFYAYSASGADLERGAYHLSAVFGRVDGVTPGAEVRIAGVKIGSVSQNSIDPASYEAKLKFSVSRDVQIPDDSIAKIVSDGILGGSHVAIEPGASETMLKDGDVITLTQGSVDLLGLAVQAFTSNAAGAKKSEAPSAPPEGVEP
jgi:phospholipid/cholesterol/gamma-HCH transport system substrate-binding protein